MTAAQTITAIMSAMPLSQEADALVPEWIHVLPAPVDGLVQTENDFGPFPVGDLGEIITRSLAENDKLPVDFNHSTDTAAPNGLPSPAVGWIVELQARDDGIWWR